MNNFESRLKGGHPNSLGNTIEIVEEVLADEKKFDELFNCYSSNDELVRLRTSNAMKRICIANEQLLVPYLNIFLRDIAKINQASTKWTLAQMFDMLKNEMSEKQLELAQSIMKNNLTTSNDWIVLTQTMKTLAKWSKKNEDLQNWLKPLLVKFSNDERKSVSGKAQKLLSEIEK